jgi:predicted lipoprotein with Yx(FWY)xxD motif
MSLRRILAALVLASTTVTACSAAGASPGAVSPAGSVGQGSPFTAQGGATVVTATSPAFGPILTAANGLALYTYAGDLPGTSACTGDCATTWPPLTVPAGQQPSAGPGVTGTLTTVTRADGTIQVAYDGMPLYAWRGDTAPGDVTGDGVDGFSVAKAAGGAPPPAGSAAPSGSGGRYGY